MKTKLQNRHILWFILAVATILRFYHFISIPLTHDEFSALFRLQFDSFGELIEKGVKPDGHPAGVQVFLYYWTHLFGTSPWVVKLPFTIAGVLSIYLIYRIAKIWYNPTVGIISASFLATMQFTVMYSQIARPYISGLLLSLAMVYCFSKMILEPDKKQWKYRILFVLFAALCAYNHYFSLLFAILLSFVGLFFIKRNQFPYYVVSGIVIFLLFLPYFPIFLYQLSLGGVGQWLHKPSPWFFYDFIRYIFNFSTLEYLLVLALIVIGFRHAKASNFSFRKLILFASLFLLPVVVGYFYSVYVNPVLQFSVLIFSLPYLLFILFGHFTTLKPIKNLILAIVILAFGTYGLIFDRHHYYIFYNSANAHILTDYIYAKENYPLNASLIFNNPEINTYYLNHLDTIENAPTDYATLGSLTELKKYLENSTIHSDYFYFGTLSGIDSRVIPLIRDYYPNIVWQKNYFIGSTYLFSKIGQAEKKIISKLDFETKASGNWRNIIDNQIESLGGAGGQKVYSVNRNDEWLMSYSVPLDSIIKNQNNFIDISLRTHFSESPEEALLVGTLTSKNTTVLWGSSAFRDFILESDTGWVTIHYSVKLSDINLHPKAIEFKCFIWNKGHQKFLIDDFTISIRSGNPIVYGLYEPIPDDYKSGD